MLRRNEAPIKKLLLVNGLSCIAFWVVTELVQLTPDLVSQTILKYVGSISLVLWINTLFYLKNIAENVDTESFEFQRELVKLSLFVVGILILIKIPSMLSAL